MFKQMTEDQVTDVHFKYDKDSGLKSIIAIHNTSRGPALGGCRIIPYSSIDSAIADVLRLAKGMSYKAALAGLDLGGGKAVILEPAHEYNREKTFKAFGRFTEELNGRYITAMDSGATTNDMDNIATQSSYVTCTSSDGNPAPYTAKGVFLGIQACLKACPDFNEHLSGMRVAVQGLGNVGYALCELLHTEGVKLFVSDLDKNKVNKCVEKFSATGVATDQIHKTECDIFSPCGLGGILNEQSITELRCRAVAGSANNQLLTPKCGELLLQEDILYAPDYLINAGGLIFAAMTYQGFSINKLNSHLDGIHHTLLNIFRKEQQIKESGSVIADRMAENILFGNKHTELASA
ncbi:MAG: Glu/Leu/Phe/Val dehydrogenase dimerization domain-containing protein [Candidatus Endonucleobacter sp. (ex Gigantidas childressi)]|nr:Glu/Leu/Phe/Val dehydrogenase dimerization domain-containing protein [Candidatus Endonucleobacter sp. (ex Gigantidas childressi)]